LTFRCANPHCYVTDGEACALGHASSAECEHGAALQAAAEPAAAMLDTAGRVPWSGAALGLADLGQLTPRARSIVIGVMGPHDAGKTTLLTGNYLALLQGHRVASAGFAGSRTLAAWEGLAAWTRFDDATRPPTFPPHTPRTAARSPGLLHLALRRDSGEFRDVLLTDAPGEWFSRWSIKETAPDAEGARWTARHADGFLVVTDCSRLASLDYGAARQATRSLIERLGNHIAGRPAVFVWTKSDHTPQDRPRAAIREALRVHIPHAREAESTVSRPDSLVAALSLLLDDTWNPPRAVRIIEPVLGNDGFARFRGRGHDRA
jgi:hypothetical protein